MMDGGKDTNSKEKEAKFVRSIYHDTKSILRVWVYIVNEILLLYALQISMHWFIKLPVMVRVISMITYRK